MHTLTGEIGALLGQTLRCSDTQLVMTTKEELFSSHCVNKAILTQMKVSGDKKGVGYLLTQVPDAIAMGGTLIMLPDDQIAVKMQKGEFDGEVSAAYGEIANILAGSLTRVFLDGYPQQLRFVRTESQTIVPTQIDSSSNQPFAAGSYYLASFTIGMDSYELHRLLLVFPAELFDLDAPAADAWGNPTVATGTDQTAPAASATTTTAETAPTGPPIVLILSDQQGAAETFVEILASASYDCRVASFQDDIKGLLQQYQVLGIFLVMAQIGEKGFAAAIKLQSANRTLPPLIFAGKEWTRSAVLRAIKYGARDILVIPATTNEIQNTVSRHFQKVS
ncbi:MAG: hypothetical protein K0A94_06485 [Desulfuromonadales bacterium]|nr:hypothetical protein [Desulfuromonadales bacterium]